MKLYQNKLLYSGVLVLSSSTLFAAESALLESTFVWIYNNIIIVFAFIVLFAGLLTLGNLLRNLILQHKAQLMSAEMAEEEAKRALLAPWYERLYEKAWSLVPMEKESDIDLGHSFDGIRELDNKLPPWWVYMFIITIIWGIAYGYTSHFLDSSQTQTEEYMEEMEVAEKAKRAFLAKQSNAVDESNVVSLTDIAALESGAKSFVTNCAACHGQKGEGGVGPNLTDKYWIHGGSTADIFKTIKYGVPEKGMIAWKTQMQPFAIQKLTSYIETLAGTNPPNAKARQGDLYRPELVENAIENE